MLSILVGIMFPQARIATRPNYEGHDRKSRSRNRLSRAARPACPHHACPARHVAKGAGKSFRNFRTLYRPARKRQGQRLDRAAAPGVECDGRASRRPHSRNRAFAGLARHSRSRAQGDAEPDCAGQGSPRRSRQRRLGAAAHVVRRHRPDRPARRRQIHARQNAGEEDRLEFCRVEQGDRGAERIVGRRDHRIVRPGRFSPAGAGRTRTIAGAGKS